MASTAFLQWAGSLNSAWWKAIAEQSDPVSAYSTYTGQVSSVLGSSTVGDNCIYLDDWALNVSKSDARVLAGTFSGGNRFSLSFTSSGNYYGTNDVFIQSSFVAPVAGVYVITPSVQNSGQTGGNTNWQLYKTDLTTANKVFDQTTLSDHSVSLEVGTTYIFVYKFMNVYASASVVNIVGAARLLYPSGQLSAVGTAQNIDLSNNSRTGSLSGDYTYAPDGGTSQTYTSASIVDEVGLSLHNLATSTSYAISSWYYDYVARAYHLNLTDTTYPSAVVTHGDDGATVVLTDASSNTTTYTYGYSSGSTATVSKYLALDGLMYLWSKIKALIPTKTSDLANDSGYITTSSVPTNVSSLTNDSGYITSSGSITGNAATATKATQDASGNVIADTYLTKAGGTVTGKLSVSNIGDTAVGDSLAVSGNFVAGSATKTTYSMLATTRKCSSDGGNVNSATFFTNSDGTAKFCHKRGDTASDDDAYMLFDATGFWVAYSGTKGTKASTLYAVLDANTGYTKTQANAQFATAADLTDCETALQSI